MATMSLLLTGVSGYIGGTILTSLLEEKDPWVRTFSIAALCRTDAQAAKLRDLGVKPVLFKDLDDTAHLTSLGEEYDVIVHVAAGWHTQSARAFIKGLGERRKMKKEKDQNETNVYYLQISGTSNLSDRPHTTGHIETRTFSDEEDIYSYEKYRESIEPYMQRTTDIAVVEDGEFHGVNTYIVMAPTIFGLGTGPWNRFTIPVPLMMEAAVKRKAVAVLGNGKTVWSHIHIQDVADLYVTLLRLIQQGEDTIPQGRKGIYFCESGQNSHLELSEKIASAAKELGVLETDQLETIGLEEAGREWTYGMAQLAELTFGANARTKAVLARKLGWKAKRGDEWKTAILEDMREYLKNPPPKRDLGNVMSKLEAPES